MRLEIRDAITRYSIPRGTVARLAGLHLPDLSGWLNSRTELNPIKIERVREVVAAIVEIVQAGREGGVDFNLRDPENVRRLISKAARFKSETALQDTEADLERIMGEADKAFSLSLK
jgi:hypothetical protein